MPIFAVAMVLQTSDAVQWSHVTSNMCLVHMLALLQLTFVCLPGALKRVDMEVSEELIMYRTMLDLIKPKLVYLDLPLFMALLSDLFPSVEQPPTPAGALRLAIEADLLENNLQVQHLCAQPVATAVSQLQQLKAAYGTSTQTLLLATYNSQNPMPASSFMVCAQCMGAAAELT